jgi:hypothetical protein
MPTFTVQRDYYHRVGRADLQLPATASRADSFAPIVSAAKNSCAHLSGLCYLMHSFPSHGDGHILGTNVANKNTEVCTQGRMQKNDFTNFF